MMSKILSFIFTAIVLLGSAVAYGQEQSKNQSTYDETLRLALWEAYTTPELIKEFKELILKKHKKSIQVDMHTIYDANDFFDLVRGNQVDVFCPGHNLLKDERFNFIAKKLIIPIPPTAIKNLNLIEPRFRTNEFVTADGNLYGVPIATGGYTLLYKKSEFKEPPQSWNILWDPQFKGRYAISRENYENNIYITALAMGLPSNKIGDINIWKSKEFNEKLKTLVRNARTWVAAPHDREVKDLMLTASWCLSHSVLDDKKKEWAFAYIKEGYPIWTDYLTVTRAVNRSSFAKTLAFEWLDFMLTPEVQSKLIIDKLRCYSAVPSAYQLIKASEKIQMQKEIDFLFQKIILTPILTTRSRNGMKMIYENAFEEVEKEKKP